VRINHPGERCSRTYHRPTTGGHDFGAKAEEHPLEYQNASVEIRNPGELRLLRSPPAAALERDLHDGVQNELMALIVKLARAEQDPETPPRLAVALAELEAHAQAALESVRNIARGFDPPLLADFGLREALHAEAMRVAISVRLVGTAPRTTEQAEQAVYFSCSEAIQNAVKHAGRAAQVTVRLNHQHETLRVRIADDGMGFHQADTPEGVGLRNIRYRIEAVGGSFKVASRRGVGTVLTISLPWPAAGGRR
jgi:signal transduction histidine kinase